MSRRHSQPASVAPDASSLESAGPPPPRIRLATFADQAALSRLFVEVRRATFTWRDPHAFSEADFEEQTLGESVWLAEGASGEILGFISIWEPDAFIHHLYVLPAYQRQGIGRALLNHTRRWLPLPHRLKCLELNSRALRFYRQEGWVEIGQGGSQDDAYRHLEYAVSAESSGTRTSSTVEVTPTRSAYPRPQRDPEP
ncbi:MAG TPA: GNAT family N-acetyltransferase [Opitutaceae bacterium]|nr:GNAT family N-acetyltransferase [Opitutaceae bacterium]